MNENAVQKESLAINNKIYKHFGKSLLNGTRQLLDGSRIVRMILGDYYSGRANPVLISDSVN
jgi:hypothetical protein